MTTDRRTLLANRLAEVFREISFIPDESYGPHRHHRLEVNYVKKGSCHLTTATGTKKFSHGDLMVIPSGASHLFVAGNRGATLIQLEFMPEIFTRLSLTDSDTAFLSENGTTVLAVRSDVRIRAVIQNIIWELHNMQEGYYAAVTALYAQLWILLQRAYSAAVRRQSLPPALSAVVNIMESATGKNMSVTDIAATAGVSTRYLRRIFQDNFHTTPGHYLAARRIEKAKEMLANTSLSIKEIAYASGFSSPRQFSAVFRRLEGYPPDRKPD